MTGQSPMIVAVSWIEKPAGRRGRSPALTRPVRDQQRGVELGSSVND